jgi:hypothetical protein
VLRVSPSAESTPDEAQHRCSLVKNQKKEASVAKAADQGARLGWYSVLVVLFLLNLYIMDNARHLLNPPLDQVATLGEEEEASIIHGSLLVQLTAVSLGVIGLWLTDWTRLVAAGRQNKLALA